MKYHFVYSSGSEKKVIECDTDDEPPKAGDYVQLPFGKNQEICRYLVVDIYSVPQSPDTTIYFIEVKPA